MLLDELRSIRENKIVQLSNAKNIDDLYDDIVHKLKRAAAEGECQIHYCINSSMNKLVVSILVQRLLEQKLKVHTDDMFMYIYFGVMNK